MRLRLALPLAAILPTCVLLAPVALTQPADPGHSGHRPSDSAVIAVRSLYSRMDDIATSVTTTAAGRVAYGTADGRVHLLADGQPLGQGTDLSERPDPFGSGAAFASSSEPASPGQLFVTHNGPEGVSIAQLDEASGELVQRVPVAVGYTIRSSALLSPPLNGTGDRALLFVAIRNKPDATDGPQPSVGGVEAGTDGRKLFKVTITRAQLHEAGIGPVTDTGGIEANPDASPSLVYLTSNNRAVEPYVAVGTSTGRVLTYSVALLAPGPHHSTGGQYDRAMTPAVPVTPSGAPPALAPPFFLASTDGKTTVLHRVTRPDTSLHFAVADSPKLPGGAAAGIATNQLPGAPGLVYVTTAKNLYALDANTLSVQAQFSPTELPPGLGFARTTPSVTGNLVFVGRNNGEQLALDARTLQPVPFFSQDPGNQAATASFGQPALSNNQVLFASDRGIFVYGLD